MGWRWRNISERRGRRMLSKEKFANRLSRLLSGGRSRTAAAVAALAALAAVVAAGVLLASRASDLCGELMRSSLVAVIATPGEQGQLSQILGDPEKSELLMKYINSMAGVVTNMEVSPRWHLSQFTALLDAAEDAGVVIGDFTCDAGGRVLTVYCAAPDGKSAATFAQALRENGSFSRVELKALSDDGEQNFLTDCYFE